MENLEEKIKEKIEELKQKKIPFQILENVNSDDGIFAMKKDYLKIDLELFSNLNILAIFIFFGGIIFSGASLKVTIYCLIISVSIFIFKYVFIGLLNLKESFYKIYLMNLGNFLIFFKNGIIFGNRIYNFSDDKDNFDLKWKLREYYDNFGRNVFFVNEELKDNFILKMKYNNSYENSFIKNHVLNGKGNGILLLIFGSFAIFIVGYFLIGISVMIFIEDGNIFGFIAIALILIGIIFVKFDFQKYIYPILFYLFNKSTNFYLKIRKNEIYKLKSEIINLNNSLNLIISSGEDFKQTIKTFYNGDISNISSDLSKNIQILHKNISLAIISKSKLEKEIGNDEKLNEIIDLLKIQEFLKFQFNNPINLLIVFLVKYGKENEKMLLEVKRLNLKDKEIILENNIKTIKETLEKLKSLNI